MALPSDQHPGAERRRGSRPRASRAGLCRGGGRGARSWPALGRGRQGDQEPDQQQRGRGGRRQCAGRPGWHHRTRSSTASPASRRSWGEIASSSAEQSSGVTQVGEAITQMDKVTQQNAALVEESAAAAESLKAAGRDHGERRRRLSSAIGPHPPGRDLRVTPSLNRIVAGFPPGRET